MERVILHCDMNNFYASVECFLNPKLRGKAVAVCGDPEKRHGIVLAKSMPAKLAGVKTGEALWQARQKCPDIIFVPPHYDIYMEYSKKAKEIYNRYTNRVEGFGLDECWLDLTDKNFTINDGKTAADELRKTIKKELGVTISAGVSFNKIFAKLGSDMRKPDYTTVISKESFKETIWKLPVSELLYVGRKTTAKLKSLNILTIGDLANADPSALSALLGKVGLMLKKFAEGKDDSPVSMADESCIVKSIGNGITLPYDLYSEEDIKITLIALCESVARRLRRQSFCCRGVALGVRDDGLRFFERQTRLNFPTASSEELFKASFALCREQKNNVNAIRALTVKAISLTSSENEQISLLPEYETARKFLSIDNAVDKIREKYGHESICRAVMLKNPPLGSINPFENNVVHPVSFLKEAIAL